MRKAPLSAAAPSDRRLLGCGNDGIDARRSERRRDGQSHRWLDSDRGGWRAEAANATVSRLTITSIAFPDYWVNAIAEGASKIPACTWGGYWAYLPRHTDPHPNCGKASAFVAGLCRDMGRPVSGRNPVAPLAFQFLGVVGVRSRRHGG
jgi:hypothetical protein